MDPIRTESLTYRYGNRRGVAEVSLRVPEGSLYGFLGPNGAGKTTTIRLLLGFLRPTSGHAEVFGLDCWKQSAAIKRDVGYVPGDLRLWPWLTGESGLRLFGSVRGMDLMPGGRRLAEMLELDLRVRVRRMSKGMRQKLGLILAMAHQPRLLILDEPTSGLDPLMQDRLLEQLRGVTRAGGTVFFSSHTLSEVEKLCDRLAIVREGRIVFDGLLADLQRREGHLLSVRWIGPAPTAADLPPGMAMLDPEPERWSAMFEGPIDTLTRWLASQRIEELSITRPDLETLFRGYYQADVAARADARPTP